jgi:hypothetical protein
MMEIRECAKEVWDSFVDNSPQGTVYCRSTYLDTLELEYDLLMVVEDDVPQLGVIVLKDNGQVVSSSGFFIQYHGFLMKNGALDMPGHRLSTWLLKVSEFMIDALSKRYDKISLCLHPSWYDMRPLLWFNYHAHEKGRFKLDPRYTGLLRLNQFKSFDEYCMSVRKVRRYEYKQAIKQNLVAYESDDIDMLNRLHLMTFNRQGLGRSELITGLIKKITTSALKNNYGRLLVCKDADQNVLSANLFLFDKNCAYYHMGGNDPQHRDTFSGTFLVFEQLKYFFEKNIPLVDFNGVNSPNRGDYKMSFNLTLACYFGAEWSGVSS